MSNELRKIGDVIVNRVRIIGTGRDVYSAWELSTAGEHHVIATFDGTHYGRIDTKDPPEELEDLSRGKIRISSVKSWYESQNYRAIAYIIGAFPEVLDLMSMIDGGQIVLEGEHV